MFTSAARRGKSQAYHSGPSRVHQSAHDTLVRKSRTPNALRSARARSTCSYSPTRNHSTMPIVFSAVLSYDGRLRVVAWMMRALNPCLRLLGGMNCHSLISSAPAREVLHWPAHTDR